MQDEFLNNGYIDILEKDNAKRCGIELEEIYDLDNIPDELIGVFISEIRDELFILLNGNKSDINVMCDNWDDRIRVFTIVNHKSEIIHKLKYNIIQLIVCSDENVDKNKEGNLQISRKIIIKGNMTNLDKIVIDDLEAIELPFHMIPPEKFTPDKEKVMQLKKLLPSNEKLLEMLEKKTTRALRKEKNGILNKTFKKEDFDRIKEWIKA